MMAAIMISSDCILIGIIVELIVISLDRVSMSRLSNQLQSAWIVYRWMSTVDFDGGLDGWFNGGFYGRFDSGFNGRLNLAVLGYQPQGNV